MHAPFPVVLHDGPFSTHEMMVHTSALSATPMGWPVAGFGGGPQNEAVYGRSAVTIPAIRAVRATTKDFMVLLLLYA